MQRRLFSLVLGSLLCTTALLIGLQAPAASPQRAAGAKVTIQLNLAKNSFTVGEDIEVEVSVTNPGGQAIQIPDPFHRDNWQPVYTLTGPEFPGGKRFSFRSAVLGDSRPSPADVPLRMVTLAPGQTIDAEIPLQTWAPIRDPGSYQLTLAFDLASVKAASPPVQFTLHAHALASLSVGVDVGMAQMPGYWLEWLQQQSSGQSVYSALYVPPERDQPGFRPFSVSAVAQAGPAAQDILSPWTSYNRQAALYKWRAWRDQSAVLALTSGSSVPSRIELPGPPTALVRPALMTRQGELDIVVLGNPRQLMLVRFLPPTRSGAPTAPRIVWTHMLPYDVVGARAAVLADTADARRQVVLLANTEDAALVSLLSAGVNGAPSAHDPVRIAEVRILARSVPAIRQGAGGITQVSALVETRDKPQRLGLVDLSFDGNGKLIGQPRVTVLPALASKVRAAAVQYSFGPEAAARRDWAVLLESGRILSPGRPADGSEVAGKPVLPLELLPTAEGTYLVTVDARNGPVFSLLP